MARRTNSTATDIGLLALRGVVGGLLAGHGAQKLFGSFGGYGLQGTAGWLESMGLKPGQAWAVMAGGSEFGSGILTALGFLNPIGPIAVYGPMLMAWNKAHAGKPIWVTSGGAELPLVYMAASTALALSGPGRYSVDHALNIKIPAWMIGLTLGGVAAGVAAGALATPDAPQEQTDEAAGQLQAGTEAGDNSIETELAS